MILVKIGSKFDYFNFILHKNVYKCKFLNVKDSNYFILKKTYSDFIDPRSKKFSKLNTKNLSKSVPYDLSLFSLKVSRALFKLKNIININSIHDVIYFKK